MKGKGSTDGGVGAGRVPALLYALTIFTSAFLTFQVQPIAAKYILPWYGGSQAVWSVSLLFFQAALFFGYLYAHLLRKVGSRRREAVIHCVLLAASLATLPIVPDEGWRAAGGADPTWRILGLLAVTLGLPCLLLASTSPLVQSWYPRHYGMSTYRLYAVSNVGSLLGLVSYPFLVEPALTRTAQAVWWSWGMGAFAALAGLSAVASLRTAGAPAGSPAAGSARGREAASPNAAGMRDPQRTVFWILLPALGSVLLLSTTNKIVQELVAVPFLWIVPLTVYLLTFIAAFQSPRFYDRRSYLGLLVVSFGGVLWFLMMREDPPLLLSLGFYLAALFSGCMVCHGELVRLTPPTTRLTAFYLCIAAGGALGGVFVALVAPAVFDGYTEFPLSLALIPAAWLAVRFLEAGDAGRRRFPPAQAGAAGAAVAAFAGALFAAGPGGEGIIARDRNFYGTLTVAEYGRPGTEGYHRAMRHGRILHGLQYLHPKYERLATTYFTDRGGAGMTLANYPRRKGKGLKIGVVGLGVGTLAAWTLPGDTIRYYEINPAVERMAREYFTYLGKSAGRGEVALGDGRLVLEAEPPQGFDVLVLDAFNNDSPPVHLLTRESFGIYLRHLKPEGALAVNITSKYINFIPVISELAGAFRLPWTTVIDYNREDAFNRTVSFWAILTRNPSLQQNEALNAASSQPEVRRRVPLWTDDYTSLFDIVEW